MFTAFIRHAERDDADTCRGGGICHFFFFFFFFFFFLQHFHCLLSYVPFFFFFFRLRRKVYLDTSMTRRSFLHSAAH